MKKKKILIVDDDKDFVTVTKAVFETRPYNCSYAYSAKEGLEKIKKVKPDLIILDIMMEDISSGFGIMSELRMAKKGSEYFPYSKIPILIVTNVQKVTKLKFKETLGTSLMPVEDFIEKPIGPMELLAKVDQLLEK